VAVATLLALGPTLLFALLLWWLDRYEKEPIPLLLLAFVWGAVPAILFALIFELGVGLPLQQVIVTDQTREITEAALVAPLVEEAVKAVILVVLFLAYKREFDDALDGIIYGAMVGLGFALVENVLYFTMSAYDNIPDGSGPQISKMFGLWIFRAGLFGLNHSTFTAFTGAALGYARSLKSGALRGFVVAVGLGTAMVLHAVHNALTTTVGVLADSGENGALVLGACLSVIVSDWGALVLIVIVAVVSSVNEGRVIQDTLWEEVALGRLTSDEYATLISGRKRWTVRWSVLFASGFRRWRQIGKFFDLATELAFRKHRMNEGDPIDRSLSARDIAQLRSQIDNLKMAILFGT
jgi:protease PrsW